MESYVFSIKGVIIGSIISGAFGMWMSIGSFMIKKHLDVLPSNTENCVVLNTTSAADEYNIGMNLTVDALKANEDNVQEMT